MKSIFTKFCLFAFCMSLSGALMAQFSYNFSQSTTTYTPVSGGTNSFNFTWDDDLLSIPIGFNFSYYDKTHTELLIVTNGLLVFDVDSLLTPLSDTIRMISVFGDFSTSGQGADLIDRGYDVGIPQSPIVYITQGMAPNRVLIIEWQNAGFFPDINLTDFVNVQARLYESTNHIEIIVGPNSVDPVHYEPGSTGPVIGISAWDVITGNMISGLYLNGSPASALAIPVYAELNTTPANGTLYNFTPSSTAVKELTTLNFEL